MQESSDDSYLSALGVKAPCSDFALDDGAQLPRNMENANAVCKASMRGTRKYKLRDAKLFNPTKSLELGCID